MLDRKLVINEAGAPTARMIFERFLRLGSATTLVKGLTAPGAPNERGQPSDKGFLSTLINDRAHLGEPAHKGTAYSGEHEGVSDQALWVKVHSILQESPRLWPGALVRAGRMPSWRGDTNSRSAQGSPRLRSIRRRSSRAPGVRSLYKQIPEPIQLFSTRGS